MGQKACECRVLGQKLRYDSDII